MPKERNSAFAAPSSNPSNRKTRNSPRHSGASSHPGEGGSLLHTSTRAFSGSAGIKTWRNQASSRVSNS